MGPRSRAIHDYNYQIHIIDEAGDILATLGEMNGFGMAKAAFEASLNEHTWSIIVLRNGGRVIETAKTGGYSAETKLVDLEWRKS